MAADIMLWTFPESFWLHQLWSCWISGNKTVDSTNILDAYLKCILENVRLSYLLERVEVGWDADLNWEDTLSLGEQQRLGMVSDQSTLNALL